MEKNLSEGGGHCDPMWCEIWVEITSRFSLELVQQQGCGGKAESRKDCAGGEDQARKHISKAMAPIEMHP